MSSHGLSYQRALPIIILTFVDVLGLTIVVPLLHLYASVYNATPLQVGLVATAFPLAQLIGVPMMGALSDRYGRKPLLLISQIATCISFLMLAAATSLEMVILSRVVDGIFGANFATAQAAMTDLTDEKTRAQGLGLTGAAFGVGFILGPAIALFALEFTDSLAAPALTAALYSLISIFLTVFIFRETLPASHRKGGKPDLMPVLFNAIHMLRRPQINPLLLLMFLQQIAFFAFESLLGLFMLTRLGFLGTGSALVFIYIGFILIYVQGRLIGRWSRRYGDRKVMIMALGLLAAGLLLVGLTPEQPHPLYVRPRAAAELQELMPSSTEAIIGDIETPLPDDSRRGFGGLGWFLVALIPVGLGAGMLRPALNSLMTKRVHPRETGAVLGVSASLSSLANAIAPLAGGWAFQMYGPSAPFLAGGMLLALLFALSQRLVRPAERDVEASAVT
ncbi:MAG: MFS transporter [Chloroflexota bacterium]|nr:MAG: hypothetical protein DIU68_10945 [Chloroflexota bacterium]